MEVVRKYGADALRIYLINSPVVRAEPLRFAEEGVKDVVKAVLLPWFHAYRFFVENVQRFESVFACTFVTKDVVTKGAVSNVMDRWILSAFQSLVGFVRTEMAAYRLYTVTPRLLAFIESLTNWSTAFSTSTLHLIASPCILILSRLLTHCDCGASACAGT